LKQQEPIIAWLIKLKRLGSSRKIYSEFWRVNVKEKYLFEDLIVDRNILTPI
jgi:hypothetical protein